MKNAVDYLGIVFRVTIAVFLFVLIQYFVISVFGFLHIDTKIYEGLFTLTYSLITIAAFTLYSLVISYKREPLIELSKPSLLISVASIVIAFGLLGIVDLYLEAAYIIAEKLQPVAQVLEEYSDRMDRFSDVEVSVVPYWDTILDFISTVFTVTLAEELVFRGVIFGEFKSRFHPVVSALLSAVIFGLLHGLSIHIGYALICGFALALIYHYTESIWISYIVHAVFNLIGSSLFMLLDSGIFGDLSNAASACAYHAFFFELFCIIPGIVSFILLYMIYKERKKNEKDELNDQNGSDVKKQEEVTV